MKELDWQQIRDLIERTLHEDLSDAGDITGRFTIPEATQGHAVMIAKQELVLAGLSIAEAVLKTVDSSLIFDGLINDGERVPKSDKIAEIEGNQIAIFTAERTALNFLQRLSGIATITAKFVKAVEGTGATILDTRKTTPQLRALEKYAVRMGGGQNHRFGLYDMILIKDNHIDAAGGIGSAVEMCLQKKGETGEDLAIEVETRTLDEVREALQYPIQRIMLDNMSLETMSEAVCLINKKVEVEASGNVTLGTVRQIALTGVDFISVGALTHSAPAADISLRVERV